ncbi:C2 domain-containing protein 5-like isoform X2 [Eriocheir sinensis]|uniref:C2 domain-containing protein 5-like isoform X2 n=1 Tax=Eriocheir sinensis TaxID=95602 RepID=UPI0021C9CA16|nr:C2 domain-containing protein 5-like isoform X2 [Eriocheir sinensis]
MPGKVKVRVLAGRNLPVMDRSSDTTDAYVEVKLGQVTFKTEVFRKSLNPQWNSEWFRFEVDDQELQDEPLQIRLMDHDTYSANDAIGKVYVDLNPLLLPPPSHPSSQRPHDPSQPGTAVMSGWLPVYDTMHGIRGEVNIVVKVDLFSDFNRFRQSSCGVQFFFTPEIPAGHRCQNIVGFVEELVVNDDPEYQWIDKIRTPRASNEARQTLFSKLSGELQRRIGLKVLELGGNAVISYRQYFDLEGETGIVVRGLGSAVTLVRLHYDTSGGAGTTHSPSPLRELTNQREEEGLVLENIYAASSSPSHPLMPISVVHLPAHKLSTTSAPPSCLWFPAHPIYNLHVSHSTPYHGAPPPSPNSPSQWLDLMVPGGEGHEGREGRGSRWVLRGLPLRPLMPLTKRKSRPSASLTQHPPVFMQRQASMARPHPTQGLPKAHKARAPKTNQHCPASSSTHCKPANHDSLESLRAGLRRTAQRVMRLRVGLEKSQSFDTGTSHSRPGSSHKGPKSVGRLLKGRSHSRRVARQAWSGQQQQIRESLTSPDGAMEEWDLDSPDIVEVESLEETDLGDDEEGPEVTSIEYSFKGVSAAHSDPTLNKSVFAKQQLAASKARPPAPIELVSSDEEDCSSGQASSDGSVHEGQGPPARAASTSGKQKFYLSEESLESITFHEGEEAPTLDLPVAPCRATSDSQLAAAEENPAPLPRVKSHSFSGQDKSRTFSRAIHDQDDLHMIDGGEAGSHTAGRKAPPLPTFQEHQNTPVSVNSDEGSKDIDGGHSDPSMPQGMKAMILPLDLLHPNSPSPSSNPDYPFLPAIAVTPSTPVLTARYHALPTSLEQECGTSGGQGAYSSLPERLGEGSGGTDLTLPKAASCTSFTSVSFSSSTSTFPTGASTSLPPPPPPPPLTLSLLPPPPPPPPLTLSVLPSLLPPSFPFSVSMENQEALESALDVVVCAKCAPPPSPTPPSPRPASSLDMLAEVRPGSAPSVGSPKRHSARSRHTSGCYPPFVSRSPLPPEPDATPAPPVPQANGVVGGGPGGGGTAVNSSPTHSGKLASPARTPGVSINRRSSESDLSITPKGSSLAGSGGSSGGGVMGKVGGGTLPTPNHRPFMTQESFDLLEYPFLTMKAFPSGFILHLGGTVSARSVKLLDRPHTPEEVETRDNWWTQLRMEIRSHTRALACNVVLGYEEFTTISDEVIVLNATGTAAVISLRYLDSDGVGGISGLPRSLRDPMTLSLDRKDFEQQQQQQLMQQGGVPQQAPGKVQACKDGHTGSQTCMSRSHPCIEDGVCGEGGGSSSSGPSQTTTNPTTGCPQHPTTAPSLPPLCAMCHVPYSETSLPFRVKISKCAVCRKGKVPDVLFTTLELPTGLPVTGIGCLIQARVARPKKDLKGELNAKEISDSLPFLEYELHKHLINKMKIKGMNALFGLRVRVTVGERLIVGVATATAVFLSALPPPPVPRVTSGGSGQDDERRRVEVQRLLHATIARNKECYGLKHVPAELGHEEAGQSDTEDSEDDLPEIDLSSGNKDTSVLELDDMEDAEMIDLLVEGSPPVHLVAVTTQLPPGVPTETIVTNLQMFTRVWRAKVPAILSHNVFNHYFDKLLQSVYFKVRKLSPCIISGLQVNVELPEEDEIQISLFGMVLGQGAPSHAPAFPQVNPTPAPAAPLSTHPEVPQKKAKQDDGEMIFKMEEVVPASEETSKPKTSTTTTTTASTTTPPTQPSTTTTTTRPAVGGVAGALSITPVSSFHSIPSSTSISSTTSSARSSLRSRNYPKYTYCHYTPKERYGVEITPLSYIPGARIESYLGNLNFFFIRESTSIKESGGLSGFMGSFVTEVLALVRAHVAALGGNAMIAYFMSECVLLHNPYKNQGQCLINVGGDVVQVQYNAAAVVADVPAEE